MAKKTTNFDDELHERPNPTSRSSGASKWGKCRAAAEAAELKTSPQYGHGGVLNSQESETQWLDAQYPDVSHADDFEHVHDPSDRDFTKDSHPAERYMKDNLDLEKRDELQWLRGDLLGCRSQLHEAELRFRAAHHEILELKEEKMRLNEELMLLKARSLPVSGTTKTMVKSELTVIQININARPLLQHAIDTETARVYSKDASPEFTPMPSRKSTPPSTPLPSSCNLPNIPDPTLQTLEEVSNRLQGLSSVMSNPGLSRKAKRNVKKRLNNRANRATKEHAFDPLKEHRKTRSSMSNKYARPRIIKASFVLAALTIARYANVGVNRPTGRSVPSLAQLQRAHPDFTVVRNPDLQPIVITDKNNIVLVMFAPGPDSSSTDQHTWDQSMSELVDVIDDVRDNETVSWLAGERDHRRGKYPFISFGGTHGNGRLGPDNLKVRHPVAANILQCHEAVKRIAGHQDALFNFYSPKLYDYCQNNVNALRAHKPHLDRPYSNSIYTTSTVNMGPSATSNGHVDNLNSPVIMCGITSLGPYDHKKGGHFIFYDLKLIVEFSSGWTAHLPSATLHHGNTQIQKGERRYSITQYIPGSLFRWVRHKFRLAKDVPEEERIELDGTSEDRIREAWGLFSKFDELEGDRAVFLSLP